MFEYVNIQYLLSIMIALDSPNSPPGWWTNAITFSSFFYLFKDESGLLCNISLNTQTKGRKIDEQYVFLLPRISAFGSFELIDPFLSKFELHDSMSMASYLFLHFSEVNLGVNIV